MSGKDCGTRQQKIPALFAGSCVHALRTRPKSILYSEKQPEVFMVLFFALALIAWGVLGLVLFSLSEGDLEEDGA